MDKVTIVVMFLGGLIFFSHLLNKLFDKTKVPNVLILMTLGIGLGFFVDGKVFFGEIGRVFTTTTLILILFESGTNLKLSELKSSILSATLVTVINFVLTVGIITGIITWLTDLEFITALYIGSATGGTSSAIVIPIVQQLKTGQKARTVLTLESAFTGVLCLIVGLAVLESMQAGDINAGAILNQMWKSFLIAILLGILGGIAWSVLLNWVRALKNSTFTTMAFAFLIYGCAELLGMNGGIAALSFGIILGNSEYFSSLKWWKKLFKIDAAEINKSEKNFYSEIIFILQTYFFVYAGMVMEFGSTMTYLISIMIITLIILCRIPTIMLLVRKDCSQNDRLIMSVLMPKGLVAVVLASIPLQEGLPQGQEIAEIGYAITLSSIILSSILVIIAGNSSKEHSTEEKTKPKTNEEQSDETASESRADLQQ
ncbi:MAG: cation:proton antiporter [Bacteroidales bacterium]|nr:cation:proton antiporter [Bacteroidales bacterium]